MEYASGELTFSHIGFHVTDLERTARFYKDALRFTETDRGTLGERQVIFLSRNPDEHHQIVLFSGRPLNLAFNPINQISLRVPDLTTLRRVHVRALAAGATDMQVVTHGNAVSLYCRDPDGNRLEIFMDTPWYCYQPLREPVDLEQADDALMAQVELIARRAPNFMRRTQWRESMARRMAADQSA